MITILKLKRMKKSLYLIIFFLLILLKTNIVFAADSIKNYDVNIKVNHDSSILITENIKYDFGESKKHGILRDIPVKYNDFKVNKSIQLNVESVIMDGINVKNVITDKGSNKNIKIGDINEFISGEHNYTIVYSVKGAMSYFDSFDEIYWNVIGNFWNIPIENATGTIELPSGVDMTKLQISCYFGILGSKEKCGINILSNSVLSKSIPLLNPGEGLTLAIGFPKGIVNEPTKFESIISLIFDNIIIFLPILVFIIMFFVWKKYGKEPKGYSTIIAQYEPPKGMKPTLVGSLVDGSVDFRDIISGLIYLAEQGFIKIKKIENGVDLNNLDYELEIFKEDTLNLEKTEKDILGLFFNNIKLGQVVKISDLKNDLNFSNKIESTISGIYKDMKDRGFYEKTPHVFKTPYLIAPFIFFMIFTLIESKNILSVISTTLSVAIIYVFSFFMGKRTKLGSETRDYILGFKDFLIVTEKDRLDFHNAPERKPEQFMSFLPYAIALGVEDKWAKQFEGINIEQPQWYSSHTTSAFIVSDFVSHISGITTSFNSTVGTKSGSASAGFSGSSGGGFSGGGRGGGGGGSW